MPFWLIPGLIGLGIGSVGSIGKGVEQGVEHSTEKLLYAVVAIALVYFFVLKKGK